MSEKHPSDQVNGAITAGRSRQYQAQICLAVLESCLALMDVGSNASLELTAISTATATLKVAHHHQAMSINRTQREEGEGHTFAHHAKTIASLLGLFALNTALIGAAFHLFARIRSMELTIAADCLSLPPLLLLLITEYSLACYHHWSEQDNRQLKYQGQVAVTVYHTIRVLNSFAFLSLEAKMGKKWHVMALQTAILLAVLVASLVDWQRQHSGARRILSRLRTVDKPFMQSSSHTLCLICRDGLLAEQTADSSDAPVLTKALPCGHLFHSHCLFHWFSCALFCPTCRTSVY